MCISSKFFSKAKTKIHFINTLTKGLNATKPFMRIPKSPDSVAAYHGGLSSLRPGFKSRSGRFLLKIVNK